MLCFLTSRTDLPETGGLNPANGSVERLRTCLPGALYLLRPGGLGENGFLRPPGAPEL